MRRLRPGAAWREFSALYWGTGICDDVPALAWFLLASLVPLALGLTALAAVLLGDYAQAQALAERAARVLPADVHDELVQLILRTRENSPLLIAGSLAAMVWTSSGAVGVLTRCTSRLLAREPLGPVLGKLRSLALAGAFAVLLMLLVLLASAGTGLADRLGAGAGLVRVLGPIVSLALTIGFCTLLYRVTAGGRLSGRSALTGGAAAGLVLLATPTAAGYYLSVVASRTPVGVFLVLAGVLFTCYLVALGLLMGAGLSIRVQHGATGPAPGAS